MIWWKCFFGILLVSLIVPSEMFVFQGFRRSILNRFSRVSIQAGLRSQFSSEVPSRSNLDISRNIVKVVDLDSAKSALSVLNKNKNLIWACDTEVADIDVKEQGPIGNGFVTCVSLYGGPTVDFGNGPGGILWIENIGHAEGLISHFKDWFEDDSAKKVWHNYGFDRHVLHNHGINCMGFGGDTMHMARIWDSSRDRSVTGSGDGYSLEALSISLLPHLGLSKVSMKELFGVAKLKKDGEESKVKVVPEVRELQTNELHREKWIEYSARDALVTWLVYEMLVKKLKTMPWKVEENIIGSMFEFYNSYLVDFGKLLTDMEREGIRVDTLGHIREAEKQARVELIQLQERFISWVKQMRPEVGDFINPTSTAQMQQLFFGQYEKEELVSLDRIFKINKTDDEIAREEMELKSVNPYAGLSVPELKSLLNQRGLKVSGKKSELFDRLLIFDAQVNKTDSYDQYNIDSLQDICGARGLSSEGDKAELVARLVDDAKFASTLTLEKLKKTENDDAVDIESSSVDLDKSSEVKDRVKKFREISIHSFGMTPLSFTPSGSAQVSAAILKKMAGKNVLSSDESEIVWGTAYEFFGGGDEGKAACQAIGALAMMGQIETTLSSFLIPLQLLVDKNSRIHCSLNLNTETGRLSARKPNLQNQPALEKDSYKIRDAFIASPGNTLIVADYGQLELRVLAHITNCTSMIKAFADGGCFHSRTAVGMYPHIKEAVESGQVVLEWDYSKGQPNVPLVKDVYGSERRKAKTLNFSIAYGKTVHGLAQDWGIEKEEAEKILESWYRDRPEVREWQERTRNLARSKGYVRTMMGRYRRLPEANTSGALGGHALRAAINTPIQGSAADIVMMAMIKLWKSEKLAKLGWKQLLQIHDEVILEGPKESVDEAMAEVRSCMENPYDGVALKPLRVHLDVDAKSADSWYKAK